jgi:hypothetical protein
MISFIFFIISILFCTNSFSSITIQNGTDLPIINIGLKDLINNACAEYFKPLQKKQNQQTEEIKEKWLKKFEKKSEQSEVADNEPEIPKMMTEEEKAIEEANTKKILILKNHNKCKEFLQKSCENYCDYILKNHENVGRDLISKFLEEPLKNFWQTKRIEVFCHFAHFYSQQLPQKIIIIESELRKIKIKPQQLNTTIEEIINIRINRFQEIYNFQLEKFYQLTQEGKEFSFSTSLEDINSFDICRIVCNDFFQKMCPYPTFDAFFDIFSHYLTTHEMTLVTETRSTEIIPNAAAMELFFQSIIANQILINGSFQLIDSLPDKKYPPNIAAAVTKGLLEQMINRYKAWFQDQKEVNFVQIMRLIEAEAMTTISSFYLDTVEKKLKATYPNMNETGIQHSENLFLNALFSGIEFTDYPQLNATFEEAFKDFNLYQQPNQDAVKTLVLNALTGIKNGTTLTERERFFKKFQSFFKTILILMTIVTTYICITQLIHKVRHG